MYHTPSECTEVGLIPRLFVVGNQIANLTPILSFCHNLCCRCPNRSCEPILDIYTSIIFDIKTLQCKVFWPLQSLFESSGVHQDSNSQKESSLGSVNLPSHTFHGPSLWDPFCFGCEPKVRVVTLYVLSSSMLHHICASWVNNDDVRQAPKIIYDDKDIHSLLNVTREKVGDVPLNNSCDNIPKCIRGCMFTLARASKQMGT